jgi:hypothetical protein
MLDIDPALFLSFLCTFGVNPFTRRSDGRYYRPGPRPGIFTRTHGPGDMADLVIVLDPFQRKGNDNRSRALTLPETARRILHATNMVKAIDSAEGFIGNLASVDYADSAEVACCIGAEARSFWARFDMRQVARAMSEIGACVERLALNASGEANDLAIVLSGRTVPTAAEVASRIGWKWIDTKPSIIFGQ